MLLLSLLLHGLLLMIPVPSPAEAEASEQPEEETQDLALTSLTAPPASPTPAASPTPIATPSAIPSPVPTPVPQAAVPPAPRPQPPVPRPSTPAPSAAPPPTPAPAATPAPVTVAPAPAPPSPAFNPQVPQGQFVAGLSNVPGLLGFPPEPKDVDSAECYYTSQTDANALVPGIVGQPQWFNDLATGEVLASLQQTYSSQGITFNPIANGYCNSDLYELKTAAGQPFLYVSLVAAPGGASTYVFSWNRNPSDPNSQSLASPAAAQ